MEIFIRAIVPIIQEDHFSSIHANDAVYRKYQIWKREMTTESLEVVEFRAEVW